jgi:hypothetical protein
MSDDNPPAGERAPPSIGASPKDQSRAMAEAARRSGSLNVDDIRASGGEFKNKTETFRRFSKPR